MTKTIDLTFLNTFTGGNRDKIKNTSPNTIANVIKNAACEIDKLKP